MIWILLCWDTWSCVFFFSLKGGDWMWQHGKWQQCQGHDAWIKLMFPEGCHYHPVSHTRHSSHSVCSGCKYCPSESFVHLNALLTSSKQEWRWRHFCSCVANTCQGRPVGRLLDCITVYGITVKTVRNKKNTSKCSPVKGGLLQHKPKHNIC